jgi:hypothetical protein
VEKAISKLPVELEEREVESDVQRALLKTLEDMRYNAPANKAAARPKRSQKLPPGAAYTCAPEKEAENSSDNSSSDSPDSSISDEESDEEREEDTRRTVSDIVDRLEEDDIAIGTGTSDIDEELPDPAQKAAPVGYPAESFVVAMYQHQWYIGQVLNKEKEPEAEDGDQYILLSFMERNKDNNSFKWPNRPDILNMLKEDILFSCQPPMPSSSTSSTRVNSFQLSRADFTKANEMFANAEAFNPTKISFYIPYNFHFTLSVCVYADGVCVRVFESVCLL